MTLATAMMALGHLVSDAAHRRAGFQQHYATMGLARAPASCEPPLSDASGLDDVRTRRPALTESLRAADEISALGWKLRAALDLAVLLKDRGALADARRVLVPVYDQFTDGFDAGDLRNARRFLEQN